jgi:hypothetical protein
MRNLIYNAQTKETTYEEVADALEPIVDATKEPTLEEKYEELQSLVAELLEVLNG